ncbi:hypothetical protein BKA57DRAFT_443010 [Linnemannia elongata]|nr:hypothetical protein BKA57DRAFT_443010 [Linnemannia elongata]
MTSTRSSHGTKRPAQAPNPDSLHLSESDDSEHEDCLNHEADETVCYTQQPLAPDEDAPSPAPALPHAPAVSSAPAPSSASTSLQQEQLVVYAQQQQELFAQAARVTEKLAACTSQEEYDQLVLVMRNLNQREQELRINNVAIPLRDLSTSIERCGLNQIYSELEGNRKEWHKRQHGISGKARLFRKQRKKSTSTTRNRTPTFSTMSINTTELPSFRQMDINATDAFVVNSSSSSAPITEDIDMVGHDLDDPSHFLADNPASTGQEFDLNQFFITSDSDYNGDIDLTSELQDVLLSKRNDLAQWTKVYHQSVLRVAKSPTDHSLYATWQQECEDLAKMVRQKEKEHDSFTAAMSLGSLATESILSPTSAVIAAAKVDNKKLSLDLGTPRFGDAKHGKGQSFQVIRDLHLFLDSFKTYCENSYGETPFLASAQRLLCMAILDEQTQTGRRNKESYRNFALRLQRSVRVYRIDDSNATVLSGIMGSIPSLELNLIKNSIQKAGTSLSDVRLNSITELLTALSAMEGPDDSLKRPHSLVDDDEDDKKDASSSKTGNGNNNGRKRLRHHRNDRGGKGKANTDSAPSSSVSDSGKKTFHCDNHGDNYSHDTKNCRHCTKCNKKGHTAPYCNSDRKKNADSKGGKSYKDKREGK